MERRSRCSGVNSAAAAVLLPHGRRHSHRARARAVVVQEVRPICPPPAATEHRPPREFEGQALSSMSFIWEFSVFGSRARRQPDAKHGAAAEVALDDDASAEHIEQAADEVQAEADAAGAAGGAIDLAKGLEDRLH